MKEAVGSAGRVQQPEVKVGDKIAEGTVIAVVQGLSLTHIALFTGAVAAVGPIAYQASGGAWGGAG
ncbi:hypothetical protein WKI10_18510, partial [Bordetella pertussis]